MAATGLLVVVGLVGSQQITGAGGARAADVLRAVVGPLATAQIEATYLTLLDTLQGAGYALGGQRMHTPWATAPTWP